MDVDEVKERFSLFMQKVQAQPQYVLYGSGLIVLGAILLIIGLLLL